MRTILILTLAFATVSAWLKSCPRDEGQAQLEGRACLRKCISDEDCKSKKKKCLCDGICGLSCVKPEKECPDPEPPPEIGKVTSNGKTFGSRAHYNCPEEYRVIGNEERVCQADGTWSGTRPLCKKNIYCKTPPKIENARHNAPAGQSTFDLDTSLQYNCHPGFTTKGFARTKCFFYNQTAKWFGPDITCEPKPCSEPASIINGRMEGPCLHFNCVITYVCQPGFELLGISKFICNADGNWSPKEIPSCVPVQCPIPENPTNGKASFTSVSFNSIVSYECKYGFGLVGEGTRRCGPDKRWTGGEPACKEINCGSPGLLWNGWLEGTRTTLHAVVLFHCQENMILVGADRSICQSDGSWSSSLPSCFAPCRVAIVKHGNATLNGTRTAPGVMLQHGKSIDLECEEHFEPAFYNFSTSVTCNNGSWSHEPTCQPARCKYLPRSPRHGLVIAPKTEHGMKARFTCRDGYILVGNNVTECSYGDWIGDPPVCNQTFCKFPGNIPDGRVLLVGNMGLYDYRNYVTKVANNRQIMFECDRGFTLADGPQGKTCIRGEWAPKTDPPRCIPSQHPSFRWIRSLKRRRRAIKPGGSVVNRNNKPGGGSGPSSRRGKKKNKQGESAENEKPSFICEDLAVEYLEYEIINPGEDGNQTAFSQGAVVKLSCTHGYGVNLQNETIVCVKGYWKPDVPECNALPCKAPYIIHGTLYEGSKALYFQEAVKHEKSIELRCTRGYEWNGNKVLPCSFGEWAVEEAPECTPVPCQLPKLEYGNYVSGFKDGQNVSHGTEVDYVCNGEHRKMSSGPGRCEFSEWRPQKPICLHPSINYNRTNANMLAPPGPRRACGRPPKERDAFAHFEGLPIDYDGVGSYSDGTEILFRCKALKRKAKNRWKITCEDGGWIGQAMSCEKIIDGSGNVQAHSSGAEFRAEIPMLSAAEIMRYVNESCTFIKDQPNVVAFHDDRELLADEEFPTGSELISRCSDIGKFLLKGNVKRKCVSGQWIGITPKCEGLNQVNDLALDKKPTILFRYVNGSITQSNDGQLIVFPGTTLHMECLWIRKFGKPMWEGPEKEKEYVQGWTREEDGRDPNLEYRLTITNAQAEDSGVYTCTTPARHNHKISIIVKGTECEPLSPYSELEYSTDSVLLGTRVTFKCKSGNTLVGAQEIVCLASGRWSHRLPRCENVECPDISQGRSKNESVAKVVVTGRDVGGRAIFSCSQGYSAAYPEATCGTDGKWSNPVPSCREVECPEPPPPENGYVSGTPPYKAGNLAQFDCNQGFMMEGQPIVACQDNGKWSKGTSVKCTQACTYPGATFGGTISTVKFYYMVGETVTFDCMDGYTIKGARLLHCLRSAKWSNSIPTCVPNDTMINGLDSHM